MAVVDPGPKVESHLRALCAALKTSRDPRIIITHRHSDHAGAGPVIAQEFGVPLYAPASYRVPDEMEIQVEALGEGDRVPTDQGDLVVLEVPGHSRGHLAFHWLEADAVFVGDLLLGRGNTTWVGEYPGCVGDYLRSLQRVEELDVSVLYPAHGPPITSPNATIDRFRRHRLERLEEVRTAQAETPGATPQELAARIYGGEIPEKLVKAAAESVEAALFHLGRPEAEEEPGP